MPRTANQVKTVKSQVGATVELLAYVYRPDGNSIHQTTADTITEAKLTSESVDISLSRISPEATIAAPSLSSALWVPSIDGTGGYNFKYSLNTAAPTTHPSKGTAPALTLGWYRIVFTFSSGAVQEFSLSLRD